MRKIFVLTAAAFAILASGCTTTASTTSAGNAKEAAGVGPLSADQKRDIAQGYRDTLERLYDTTPGSRELVAKAGRRADLSERGLCRSGRRR